MSEAYICDAVRTPIGRYGGCLSSVRADDLGAVACLLQLGGNGRFVLTKPPGLSGEEYFVVAEASTLRITPRNQGGTGSSAEGGGHIKISKLLTFPGQSVYIGCIIHG